MWNIFTYPSVNKGDKTDYRDGGGYGEGVWGGGGDVVDGTII